MEPDAAQLMLFDPLLDPTQEHSEVAFVEPQMRRHVERTVWPVQRLESALPKSAGEVLEGVSAGISKSTLLPSGVRFHVRQGCVRTGRSG